MILGIGTDVVNIERVERLLKRFGAKFEQRLFTEGEIDYSNARSKLGLRAKASILAKRIAAKEAFVKAIGSGFTGGVAWKDIEIVSDIAGKPVISASGAAQVKLRAIAPRGILPRIDVSLADDFPIAQAFVVITQQ